MCNVTRQQCPSRQRTVQLTDGEAVGLSSLFDTAVESYFLTFANSVCLNIDSAV